MRPGLIRILLSPHEVGGRAIATANAQGGRVPLTTAELTD